MRAEVAGSARGTAPRRPPALTVAGLAGAGALISAYLLYIHWNPSVAVCLGLGACDYVNTSEYSVVLGVPVALLGLLAYLAVAALALWEAPLDRLLAGGAWLGAFAISLVALLYSLFLTYVEGAILHAWCPWCLLSASLWAALFALSLWQVTRRQGQG